MENRKFNISFISKEGNKASLSINSSWLIYTASAADFKKVMKDYFIPALNYADYDGNEKETDKINGYIDFMRENLETWNKAENGKNKTVKNKLSSLETVKTGKKAAVSNFEKASKTILRNAIKTCSNERTHTAYSDNGYIYVTDSYVAIRTNNNSLYNGYISENGLNMEKIFTLKNDICKVFIPDLKTVKNNCSKGKNETYYITDDNTVYNVNYLYNAMLACSYNPDNCAAYKTENNNMSLLYIENTANNTSAVIMPIKPRETGFINAVSDNKNSFISLNEYKSVIGITSLNKEEKQDPKTDNNAAIIPGKEETTKTENNNSVVMEYIKKHVVIPVTLETIENDNNYKQMKHILSDNDLIIGFINAYRYNYDYLYNNPDIEKQNNAYMYAAELFMKEYAHMHITVSEQMKDMFISDRELIAYGMTLKMFSFDLDKYGYALPDISFLETQEEKQVYKIAGIDMYKDEINDIIENKQYIIKGHSVYYIAETKKGYTAKKVYTDNDTVPLVHKKCYQLVNRDHVNKLIRFPIKQYYA